MSAPSSTYRLQITRDFTLHDAAALVPYLQRLGVGAVYVSPLLRSTSGSTHGYDVVDHDLIDPDRGGEAGLQALADAATQAGLGLVVDIVPNHMGVGDASQNRAWWDVLRNGQISTYASWFDIDWVYGSGRVLIPVLGDDFDADKDLTVVDRELRYYEHRYPIADGTAGAGTPAQIHARQNYELVSFRRADTDQNYRRFFAVTELAGLRVETDEVFDATHAEILRWVTDYGVTGIRIDHPDGLVDPAKYLIRLAEQAPQAWITVEKITEPGEAMPTEWPVAGMTGYDALAEVNDLLVDPAGEESFTALYTQITGDALGWADHVAAGKRMVVSTILQAEVRRLARLVSAERITSDLAIAALSELVVWFPVYRSYLPSGAEHLQSAVDKARSARPDLSGAIDELLPRLIDPGDELSRRFQQLTGAVMAKGVEDTAYYRYNRFVGLNEVGGFPGTFGRSLDDFHAAQQLRADRLPQGMTTLSTHDTKRGEDIRARIAVLPELPEEWHEFVTAFIDAAPIPNRAFAYLLGQTFAATGLISRDRMHAYAEKAMREAADGTGWIDSDEAFESAVHAAVDTAYDDPALSKVVYTFADLIRVPADSNSLSQKLIQLTMPGVPDVYQGSELWEDSLVDPDNRRPIDYAARASFLDAFDDSNPPPMDSSGRAKLWLTMQTLTARRDHPELFSGYTPLATDGVARKHAVVFDRGGAITVATRLPVGLNTAGGWGDSTLDLPTGDYLDLLTGTRHSGVVSMKQLLKRYPVALLIREDGGRHRQAGTSS
ncbi:MAG: malto-oligosyltrehalose synthase [Pseudonocardiales bacterium]|nr:malto-oligosyltrehalose synthase [Pseudonocardiales bacterium]